MPLRPSFPLAVAWRRAHRLARFTLAVVGATGCDRLKQRLDQESAGPPVDQTWLHDSTVLASRPAVVFRALDGGLVAPLATIGAGGPSALRFGDRGWKAFDIEYLHAGKRLTVVRDGAVAGAAAMKQGAWEGGKRVDSLPGCPHFVPAGLAEVPTGVSLLVANSTPSRVRVQGISDGAVAEAIATIPTLIAPGLNITPAQFSRYRRTVRVVSTGASEFPTIVLEYEDLEPVADSIVPVSGMRPRQFVVVMDRGLYMYHKSFVFSTLGNRQAAPRMRFLDAFDFDADGHAELVFGYRLPDERLPLEGTRVLRYEIDTWREVFNQTLRCQA